MYDAAMNLLQGRKGIVTGVANDQSIAWGCAKAFRWLGAELATGSSEIEVELDSDLTINADRLPIGTALITASDSSSPDALAFHALAGLQIHTRYVRVSAQGTIADGVWSVALGLRVVP